MILVALGSNLGDRAGQLTRARQMMNAQGMNIVAESSLHETPALMPENAPESWNIPFLNQVVQVETTASAVEVLAQLKAIEVALGRTPRERWAPREVDLDIIAYDAVSYTHLTLPTIYSV